MFFLAHFQWCSVTVVLKEIVIKCFVLCWLACFPVSLLYYPQSLLSSQLNRLTICDFSSDRPVCSSLYLFCFCWILILPSCSCPRSSAPLSFQEQQLLGFCLWRCAYKQEDAVPSQSHSLFLEQVKCLFQQLIVNILRQINVLVWGTNWPKPWQIFKPSTIFILV